MTEYDGYEETERLVGRIGMFLIAMVLWATLVIGGAVGVLIVGGALWSILT